MGRGDRIAKAAIIAVILRVLAVPMYNEMGV